MIRYPCTSESSLLQHIQPSAVTGDAGVCLSVHQQTLLWIVYASEKHYSRVPGVESDSEYDSRDDNCESMESNVSTDWKTNSCNRKTAKLKHFLTSLGRLWLLSGWLLLTAQLDF